MGILARVVNGMWRPEIGDPTFLGWLTVVAYLLAAILCARSARRERAMCSGRPMPWWLFSGVLLFLGLNKQLDLQSLATVVGRHLAKAQGWYANHRVLQQWFILGVTIAGTTAILLGAWLIRHTWRRHGLALLGLVLLIVFITIRAASFHHVDRLLGLRVVHSVSLNVALELGGISVVIAGALVGGIRRRRAERPAPSDA